MSLHQKARSIMREYRIFPKKRLGQNFMIDEHFLELMCSYAAVEPSDIILEIGAGLGFLTRFLTRKSGRVIAFEADSRLAEILRRELADFSNIELVEGNILKTPTPPFSKVVSNPPFSISSPLLFWLLSKAFNCAVLTFQSEFARRLDASIGSKNYSRLTVSTYYRADVELLDFVPKEAFYPSPDVDALIVRLKPKKPPLKVKDKKAFEEVVRVLFTQRNRKVRKVILHLLHKHGLKGADAVKKADQLPFHDKRVRELAPEDFGALANELSD